jgi:precorrin-4/cobalt-precorrin-4 C11-methyltransferase
VIHPSPDSKNENVNPIIFCGAGPGDPDLITVKGQQALAAADLVVYAGSLVPEALLKWTRPGCRHLSSAGLHLDEMVATMAEAWQAGQRVVRLHTGDPCSLRGHFRTDGQAVTSAIFPTR